MSSNTQLALVIIVVIVAIAGLPLAFVWALNTLFALSIPYTFWTWLAALVAVGCVRSDGK